MATTWSETFDPRKHHDAMRTIEGVPQRHQWRTASLQTHAVYFVRVCTFTFEFHSISQIQECLRFFTRKIRPSGRRDVRNFDPDPGLIHSLSQRWHERLPMYLLEERRRVSVVRALKQALQKYSDMKTGAGGQGSGNAADKTRAIARLRN
jgi:hypothetical protein